MPHAVFVTPSHQFPTGVVLSMARRLELLAWARKNDAWIVEDDYASEFRYGGRPLASLQGLDEGERVIYIGTLNKALFPGLRLGYAVIPRALLRPFVAARYLMDRQPSTLSQAVVAAFMHEGHFAAHIRRMRVLYKTQRDELVAALEQQLRRRSHGRCAGPGDASRRLHATRPFGHRHRARRTPARRRRPADEPALSRGAAAIGAGAGVQRPRASDDWSRSGASGAGDRDAKG